MEKLGKWFAIKDGKWKDSPTFDYVFGEGDEKQLNIESEAQLGGVIGRGKTAVKEYGQWWWIDAWEKQAKVKIKETTENYKAALESLLNCYPGKDYPQKWIKANLGEKDSLDKAKVEKLLDNTENEKLYDKTKKDLRKTHLKELLDSLNGWKKEKENKPKSQRKWTD